MPAQRTCCGQPITLQLPPRRFQILFGFIAFTVTIIVLFGSSAAEVPALSAVTEHLPQSLRDPKIPSIPTRFNPFVPSAHKPPLQANSSSGDARWYSDWRWRNPFSSSVTLDENRAVLPPLRRRAHIYTYYEASAESKKSKAVKEAEQRLLFQWRRAWWAQGFKPIVLGRPEAVNNPLYKKVQMLRLQDNIDDELARWLAWGNMGDGILAHWLVFPMAGHDNALLNFLRRGNYPQLTRYSGLKNGIYCGSKKEINDAIETAIAKPEELKKAMDFTDARFNDLFQVDRGHDSIAYYDTTAIKNKYKLVADDLYPSDPAKKNLARGYRYLGDLINAHLQTTWQNSFDKGVAVLKPLPKHMTVLTEPAMEIAGNLTECPSDPIPTSCPPNNPRCKRCISSQPKPVTTPSTFRNTTGLFSIASVPHPFTTTALNHERDTLDPHFIRRLGFKERDTWIAALTQDLLGQGVSPASRASRLKDAIAGEWGSWHTLFLTAEREFHEDLDWIFGFDIPRNGTFSGKSETPVPGPERRPKPKVEGPVVPEEQASLERSRLVKVREGLGSKLRHMVLVRDAVEGWNLADTEVWRFARAYSARTKMERRKWEEEEKGYAGAEAKKKGSAWGRWWD